ncbi:hypothetical protein FisN_24Lh203 [Fistulifera solaris]|uniref:SET domain-containing protein n=1 Tax=Fistulifera solaris TaxID=1519565 RepID=A0A1Z5K9I8_FISSO|nr:hypothetical protein FisN_24Lh203 [Fistulifera solaris]|eukprot:GAX22917.1 hypothetical protein FisN_24Lh203 [Fistulifera solaris]
MHSARSPNGHKSGDKFDRFEKWLRDNGARFDQLEIKVYDDGSSSSSRGRGDDSNEEKKDTVTKDEGEESEMRGVHALSHIPPNTLVMSIPRKCLITVEMGQATPIGQAILNSDLDLDAPKHIFLMVYLLWDRKVNGKNSFFFPYYEVLPKTLKNMPIFWSKGELAELNGSYLQQQIADRNQAIAEDYRAICEVAPQMRELATLEEFKWARMCVCSRNFGLQIDGHRTSALVPHADMLNHYRPRETKWTFDEDRQAFTITSLQHIGNGSQIYDSYGQKCNHRFLLNYGFAVEDNRELDGFCPNEVPLELYISPDDPLLNEKLEFWTRGEISDKSQGASGRGTTRIQSVNAPESFGAPPLLKRIRVCVSSNENTRLLFSLLRALACNGPELNALASPVSASCGPIVRGDDRSSANVARSLFGFPELPSSNSVLTGSPIPFGATYHRSCRDIRHPVSLRNERAALRLLLQIVERHLSEYSTTLAADVTDLLDELAYPRFSNKRHAKIQVRGEKEVLHHFARWATTGLEVLDVIEEELQEERGSIEVSSTGRVSVVSHEERPSFDYMIQRMEEDAESRDIGHHTIVRYCADVLGSLRREEFKNIRRQRLLQQEQPRARTSSGRIWRSHEPGSSNR